jgi:hypothetical protein
MKLDKWFEKDRSLIFNNVDNYLSTDHVKLFFKFIDKHYSHSSEHYRKELKDSFEKYLKNCAMESEDKYNKKHGYSKQ